MVSRIDSVMQNPKSGEVTFQINCWILLAKFMLLYITVTYMMVEATRQRELVKVSRQWISEQL
jgi:hypothetical protein